jgi:hypothetical protein
MVEQIQNRRLWKLFEAERENLNEKNGERPKEKFLYHGTRMTPPNMIYESQEGFDMRYSD